jgi:ABC-type Fe3+-hydroxamate transport system substrate-binding protein
LILSRRSFRFLLASSLALAACEKPRTDAATIRDDFGDPVRIGEPARRIVSLSPATTEILFALGAGPRLVGRSDFDLFPLEARAVPSVGNGIQPNVEAVLGTHPDLVILYASQDNRSAADRLKKAGVKTLSLKMDHISDFRRSVLLIGAMLGDSARAALVSDSVHRTLDRVRGSTAQLPHPTVFWHIWDAPLITVGAGSFMNDLVDIAGARNVYADIEAPSKSISLEDVARRDPEFILAGPIGAANIDADPRWRIVRAVREKKVLVVDTVLVARPSVRLGEAAVSLAKLLHPSASR